MKRLINKRLLLIVTFLFVSFEIKAEFATWSLASTSCSEVIKEVEEFKRSNDEMFIQDWIELDIQEYLTGRNLAFADTGDFSKLRDLGFNSVSFAYEYLLNYCRRNPGRAVSRGLNEYHESLPQYQMK